MYNRVTRILNIRYPHIQAHMCFLTNAELLLPFQMLTRWG